MTRSNSSKHEPFERTVTIKTSERHRLQLSGIFIVNLDHIS